jgi:hypothetical protein
MELFSEYSLNREFFEKALVAANHATKPFALNLGKKQRIVIDYDPLEQQVKFSFFTESEQTQPE